MCPRSLLLAALFTAAALAAPPQDQKPGPERAFRLQWRDLNRFIHGRKVTLFLPSKIKLQGHLVAVEPDGLILDVARTSDKRAYPKGRATVPRPEVQRLRIDETKHLWRAVGGAIGGGIGGLGAAGAAVTTDNPAICAAIAGVSLAVGYLLGWAGDYKVTDIVVDPTGQP